jgi:flagellar hook-basal body complex protein FliE
MVNFSVNSVSGAGSSFGVSGVGKSQKSSQDFGKAVKQLANKTNDLQTESDNSVKDLLAGKNQDINSVVAATAKADMSFKLMVGVRNKIIEAYKETMRMQL